MVKKLEKKFSNCTIVKGFFDKTLKDEKISKSINILKKILIKE